MTDDTNTFGAQLRALRLLTGLSQEELAERSGVSVRTISNLERGQTRKSYVSTYKCLANGLELSGAARAEFLAAGRRPGSAAVGVRTEQMGGPTPFPAGQPLTVPRYLPSQVTSLAGRGDELAQMSRTLGRAGEAPSIAVISGSPGVGKTALALRWAHDAVEQFPDGQLYIDLRGYGPDQPVRPADALASFLRALGVAGLNIPEGTADRAAAYRSLLAGRQVLVVLDNAGKSAQVRPLLPGTKGCSVLVTSRNPLAGLVARDGASRLELDVLSSEEAVGLLRDLIGPRVDEDLLAAAALAGYCSRLPLALRVAAEFAVARPSLPLSRLAGQLADLRKRVGLLDAGGDTQTAVRSVLSWSYQQLDAEAARVFRLLGHHPGADFDAYATAALTGMAADSARLLLDELSRAYLIRPSGPDRYFMHDLLRAYALEDAVHDRADAGEAEPSDGESRAALGCLFDYYLQTTAAAVGTLFATKQLRRTYGFWKGDSPHVAARVPARAWLETELANLVAAAAQMAEDGWPSRACGLATAIFPYLELASRVAEAITIESHALRAARRTADKVAEATALAYLGLVFLMQGRYRTATDHLRQSVTMFQHAGDQSGEAAALGSLAVVHRRQGRYQQSAAQQMRALALARQIGDQCAEAWALMRLGVVDWNRGLYDQALAHSQEALSVSRQVGDPVSEAAALTRLAVVERYLHRYEEAVEHHQTAITLFRRNGDPAGEAEAHDGLGEVFAAMGQPEQALDHHADALNLAEETGDLNEQARAHRGLAHASQAVGDHAQALSHFEEAISLFSALGAPEAGQIRDQLNAASDNNTRQAGRAAQALPMTVRGLRAWRQASFAGRRSGHDNPGARPPAPGLPVGLPVGCMAIPAGEGRDWPGSSTRLCQAALELGAGEGALASQARGCGCRPVARGSVNARVLGVDAVVLPGKGLRISRLPAHSVRAQSRSRDQLRRC